MPGILLVLVIIFAILVGLTSRSRAARVTGWSTLVVISGALVVSVVLSGAKPVLCSLGGGRMRPGIAANNDGQGVCVGELLDEFD